MNDPVILHFTHQGCKVTLESTNMNLVDEIRDRIIDPKELEVNYEVVQATGKLEGKPSKISHK